MIQNLLQGSLLIIPSGQERGNPAQCLTGQDVRDSAYRNGQNSLQPPQSGRGYVPSEAKGQLILTFHGSLGIVHREQIKQKHLLPGTALPLDDPISHSRLMSLSRSWAPPFLCGLDSSDIRKPFNAMDSVLSADTGVYTQHVFQKHICTHACPHTQSKDLLLWKCCLFYRFIL